MIQALLFLLATKALNDGRWLLVVLGGTLLLCWLAGDL